MKKIIIWTVIGILLFIFVVPKYNELNNIAIIDSIGVLSSSDSYHVYLREIIPKKNDNGITYQYKIYDVKTNNLEKALELLEKKAKKKLYLRKIKFLVTNTTSYDICHKININPWSIYHTRNVLRKINSLR